MEVYGVLVFKAIKRMLVTKVFRHISWVFNFFLNVQFKQIVFSFLLPPKIHSGPFKGMKYIKQSTGSVILPKLIGTYEDELHPLLINVIAKKEYSYFLDVGAAEGYFAVGIHKYIFREKVNTIAFELTKKGQKSIHQLIALNKTKNITVYGACTVSLFKDMVKPRSFILMDVEGYEQELLNPDIINFSTVDILVELHPNIYPDIKKQIIERFTSTHEISEFHPGEKEFPPIQIPKILNNQKKFLMNEFRGCQSWLWMEARI